MSNHHTRIQPAPKCTICNDSGFAPIGDRRFTRCECQLQRRSDQLLKASHIPDRYSACDFDQFSTHGDRAALEGPLLALKRFAVDYPIEWRGLMLIGTVGTGKTHLACALMRKLMIDKGVSCLFADFGEMVKRIGATYRPGSDHSETDVLAPLFDTEILLIDDLASMRAYEWIRDVIGLIVNQRYNASRTTIFTCNFSLDELSDRLGERLRSRLQQMCLPVEMNGPDFRMTLGSARWHPKTGAA